MGKVFGYARVSTDDQDLTVQREALKAAGVHIERGEKSEPSATAHANSRQLKNAIRELNGGQSQSVVEPATQPPLGFLL